MIDSTSIVGNPYQIHQQLTPNPNCAIFSPRHKLTRAISHADTVHKVSVTRIRSLYKTNIYAIVHNMIGTGQLDRDNPTFSLPVLMSQA